MSGKGVILLTDGERLGYIFLVRNLVELYQAELKSAKLQLEKSNAQYISDMIAHDRAVELYEKRIAKIREICANHGLSDSEIENLTKWHDEY